MKQLLVPILTAGAALFTPACGESGNPPTSPVSPTPVPSTAVTALAIVGPHVVPTGSDVTYSATATLAGGGQSPSVRPTAWTSDNPEVATIRSAPDGIGELTAKREGTAVISATYQGKTSTHSIDVRGANQPLAGANLAISYSPDPVPGRSARCAAVPAVGEPTWTFNITIAETLGVGFTLEYVSFTLYEEGGNPIYSDTFSEKDYLPSNSVVSEEFCTSLFGGPSGFFADVYEGVDDLGNRRAFTAGRLRLLPPAGATTFGSTVPIAPGAVVRGKRQRRQ